MLNEIRVFEYSLIKHDSNVKVTNSNIGLLRPFLALPFKSAADCNVNAVR